MKIFQVDAFASAPFTGNPAAVCLLENSIDDRLMQDIAVEMNLSETAFLLATSDGYSLRWFTPAYEVDLCGHATLASAHVLWEQGLLAVDQVAHFYSRSGLLKASKKNDGVELDFPAQPPAHADVPSVLLRSLQIDPIYAGYNESDYVVVVENAETIKALSPDFALMKQVDMRGCIATAATPEGPYDFISRFFAPGAGINEDPVTGSAHCCLGPYWSEKLGKSTLKAYQASPRGGELTVQVQNDRVFLTGNAVTVMEGVLRV